MISLPEPVGARSEWLFGRLIGGTDSTPPPAHSADPLGDLDLQLALYVAHELHYRGIAGVGDEWEWEHGIASFRAELGDQMLDALLARCRIDDDIAPEE